MVKQKTTTARLHAGILFGTLLKYIEYICEDIERPYSVEVNSIGSTWQSDLVWDRRHVRTLY